MGKQSVTSREAAESLAVHVLGFLAAEPERLGRFLALTGIGPGEVRTAAREPGFLAGVLEHIASDESLLVAFAAEAQIPPNTVTRALAALAGERWEREMP